MREKLTAKSVVSRFLSIAAVAAVTAGALLIPARQAEATRPLPACPAGDTATIWYYSSTTHAQVVGMITYSCWGTVTTTGTTSPYYSSYCGGCP